MLSKLSRILLVATLLLLSACLYLLFQTPQKIEDNKDVLSESAQVEQRYWLLLHRKSEIEKLYWGIPGDEAKSQLIRKFQVKVGIPGERPTPLPQLLGREYWIIIGKYETADNPETAPYFLTLNIPVGEEEPFGPTPYLECNGQCNWIIPGAFGLHGINGDESRIAKENPGSSGCIRHRDEDITFLYNLLEPEKEEIRYYIQDN